MANLRANKLTGTEVFETTGSVQFDGSGDYLSFSNSSDFAFGTGDFTIEMWVYHTNLTGQQTYFGDTYGNTAGVYTYKTSNNEISLYDSAQRSLSAVNLISANTWHHIAWTRQSGTLRAFINGSLVDSDTYDGNFTTTEYYVGDTAGTSSGAMSGHISNLRVLKGTALYTKNFTPPTRELTVIPNTVLLCCQSTTRANEERTGKTITVNGNAVANELTPGLLTDRVKSGGSSAISGSVEFDGDGDYLSLANNNEFDFDTSMTIEAYVYFSDLTSSPVVFSRGGGNTSISWSTTDGAQFAIYGTSTGRISFEYNSSGTPIQIISATGTLSANSWNHIAITYNGTTFTLYLNGINVGTASNAPTMPTTRSNIWVGMWPTSALVQDMKGFISNLRVIRGTALYTSNFIPPTRELKNLPGTVLLCCQNSKSATQEATGKTITVNGNATARYFTPPVGFDGFVNFDGATKIKSQNYFYLPTGTTEDRGGARGVFGGGGVPANNNNIIDYINIGSTGNAVDFGDLSGTARRDLGALSSSSRAVFGGGMTDPAGVSNSIDFITVSSTGNAATFGTLSLSSRGLRGTGSSTRGLFIGGNDNGPNQFNTIDYITIASTGNAQDFGDLSSSAGKSLLAAISSSTRALSAGGDNPAGVNVIEFITISSIGNSVDFGDISSAKSSLSGCSNSTRGLFAGGQGPAAPAPAGSNVIDYVTIASTGNSTDFGDLTRTTFSFASCSSPTRGVFGGGYGPQPTSVNTIDYVTIMNSGNAIDFGDLTVSRPQISGCSDSHGGLG